MHVFEMRHLISTDGCLVDLLSVGVLSGGLSLRPLRLDAGARACLLREQLGPSAALLLAA